MAQPEQLDGTEDEYSRECSPQSDQKKTTGKSESGDYSKSQKLSKSSETDTGTGHSRNMQDYCEKTAEKMAKPSNALTGLVARNNKENEHANDLEQLQVQANKLQNLEAENADQQQPGTVSGNKNGKLNDPITSSANAVHGNVVPQKLVKEKNRSRSDILSTHAPSDEDAVTITPTPTGKNGMNVNGAAGGAVGSVQKSGKQGAKRKKKKPGKSPQKRKAERRRRDGNLGEAKNGNEPAPVSRPGIQAGNRLEQAKGEEAGNVKNPSARDEAPVSASQKRQHAGNSGAVQTIEHPPAQVFAPPCSDAKSCKLDPASCYIYGVNSLSNDIIIEGKMVIEEDVEKMSLSGDWGYQRLFPFIPVPPGPGIPEDRNVRPEPLQRAWVDRRCTHDIVPDAIPGPRRICRFCGGRVRG